MGSANQVVALDNINLEVFQGDFISIIGSNGAGKSSLMNCIAGAYIPEAGSVFLGDRNITSWPEHKRARHIGRVFQDPLSGTCAPMTIEENMALALRRGKIRGLRAGLRRSDRQLFRQTLARLDLKLEDRLQDKVGLLSGGQRQALTLIMATLVRPDLLLLDEHTAALDPKTAQLILELTQEIVARDRLTTLMITHNMQHAIACGNRLIMMHQGRIILDIEGPEKAKLTVEDLLRKFQAITPDEGLSDRMLLI